MEWRLLNIYEEWLNNWAIKQIFVIWLLENGFYGLRISNQFIYLFNENFMTFKTWNFARIGWHFLNINKEKKKTSKELKEIALSFSTKSSVPCNNYNHISQTPNEPPNRYKFIYLAVFLINYWITVLFQKIPFISFILFILQFQRKIVKSFKAVSSRPFPTRFPMKNEKTQKSKNWP